MQFHKTLHFKVEFDEKRETKLYLQLIDNNVITSPNLLRTKIPWIVPLNSTTLKSNGWGNFNVESQKCLGHFFSA